MTEPQPKPRSLRDDLLNAARGMLMGCADAIPGVSGGTVALIVGIYSRLVTAISHFDLRLLRHLRKGEWRQAACHVDLRFLLALGCGIAVGLVGMLVMASILLKGEYRSLTLAAFFGMILASAVLVVGMIRQMRHDRPLTLIALGLVGAAVACWISTLDYATDGNADPPYLFLFICGCLAICAMILPGISGAMVLMILGPYEYVSGTVDQLVRLENIRQGLLTLVVFGSGCAISLILFSKILRKLLERFTPQTTALLCGFMFGALPKLWPFQKKIELGEHDQYKPMMPEAIDSTVWAALGIAVASMVFVFTIDRLSRGGQESTLHAISSKPNCERAVGP